MTTRRTLQSVCVYCGASPGRIDTYADAARILARTLVERNITLVYGGATVGIMGVMADTVLQLGGKVIGVIPEALVRKEIAHQNLTELHVTQSMHERKSRMADLSEGFIAMPGGIGTLEELFEVWTWGQLGIHDKPCGLLNVDGYFDSLIRFLDHAVAERFVKQAHSDMLLVDSSPEALLDRFVSYVPTIVPKWIDRGDT